MFTTERRTVRSWATGLLSSLALLSALGSAAPAQEEVPEPGQAECTIDLNLTGQMKDVLSNLLMRGLGIEERRVRGILSALAPKSQSGAELLKLVAERLEMEESDLRRMAEAFLHVNCSHEHEARRFARDVTVHVVLHEMGHALVREFDLPILGNEETLADAFATHYLTRHLPERAPAVLLARVQSLMLEASEESRADWPVRGEHNSDARRAYQIAALAVAADRNRYAAVADAVGMSERDRRSAADYGSEIHRSWRRVLRPLWMPEGESSREVRLKLETAHVVELGSDSIVDELGLCLRRIDWHSQVTLAFEGEGDSAGWSRSKRTITVGTGYLQRFVIQGMRQRGVVAQR